MFIFKFCTQCGSEMMPPMVKAKKLSSLNKTITYADKSSISLAKPTSSASSLSSDSPRVLYEQSSSKIQVTNILKLEKILNQNQNAKISLTLKKNKE